MSLIKNLVKEAENNQNVDDTTDPKDTDKEKTTKIIKSATDLQRLKLEKLMKNPNKIVLIPEPRKEKDFMQSVPTFVRNVMGSSAGAGSGEFHVYRHLRRKEYARQKMIQAKSSKQQLDEEYQQKLEDNRRKSEEKTAKKRAKRLKKKERAKRLRKQTSNNKTHDEKQNNSIDESSNDSNEEAEVGENDNDSCQMNTKLMNDEKHENFNSNNEVNIEENDCSKQNEEDTMKDHSKPMLDVDLDQVLNDCNDNDQAMEENEKSICQDKTKQCKKSEVEDKERSEENKKPTTHQEDCPENNKMEISQNNSKEMNNEK